MLIGTPFDLRRYLKVAYSFVYKFWAVSLTAHNEVLRYSQSSAASQLIRAKFTDSCGYLNAPQDSSSL